MWGEVRLGFERRREEQSSSIWRIQRETPLLEIYSVSAITECRRHVAHVFSTKETVSFENMEKDNE